MPIPPIMADDAYDDDALDKDSIRDLVIEMRRYILHHGIMLGECVAWERLKKLVDVGQTPDCPSERRK